jgi:hypothetical protein
MNRRTGLGRHGRIEDAAGDPLEGLVNLFDIGIVLAVAFLIAGLGLTLDRTPIDCKRARRPHNKHRPCPHRHPAPRPPAVTARQSGPSTAWPTGSSSTCKRSHESDATSWPTVLRDDRKSA